MSTCKWEDNIEMNLNEEGVKLMSHLNVLVVDIYKHDGVFLVSEQKNICVPLLLLLLLLLFTTLSASSLYSIEWFDYLWNGKDLDWSDHNLTQHPGI